MTGSTDRPPLWEGPPGPILYAGTALTVVLVLAVASAPSMLWAMGAALAVFVLAVAWLARLAASGGRRGSTVRDRVAWFAIPVALGATLLLAATDLPMQVRFELSRGDMERYADTAADRPWAGDERVGLFDVLLVDERDESVRLEIGGLSWDLFGFERFDDRTIDETAVERRCQCDALALGDGWFTYTEDF